MAYKMPIDREKATLQLVRMLRGDGPVIARELEPRMARVLGDDEEMPDVAHLLDVLGRMVKAEHEDLYAADDRRSEHGSDRYWVRRQLSERAAPELRRRVVEVRDWLRHNYGAATAKRLLKFEGRTPRATEELADLATIMVRHLPVLKPKQNPSGDVVDPANWVKYLESPLERTSDLLEQLGSRGDAVEIATEAKSKVMTAFDKTYRRVLRLAEMFYLLAGFGRVAKSLRYQGGRPAEKIKKHRFSGSA